MRQKIIFLDMIFIYLVFFVGCKSKPSCNNIENNYKNYSEAEIKIRSHTYKIAHTVLLSSDWMKSAEYYSCDGKSGYFIYETIKGKTYIHKNLEYKVWKEFISAKSVGSYYNRYIKSKPKYRINL